MRRAKRPLNPEAVKKANAAIREKTGGRPLTTREEDADLRKQWMDVYIQTAGDNSYVDSANQSTVDETKKECIKQDENWSELEYLYCDGTGVGGADYRVIASVIS